MVILALLSLATVPGCGSNALSSPTAVNLRKLANLYLNYTVSANGRAPASEQAFKKYVHGLPDFLLRHNGVDPGEQDALFVSGRDQQPIVIVYGLVIKEIAPTQAPLIAYEQAGQKGKRLVVYANTKVEEVDEVRLEELKKVAP
jgi:hypothetical protein